MTCGTRDRLPTTCSAGTGFGMGPKKATQTCTCHGLTRWPVRVTCTHAIAYTTWLDIVMIEPHSKYIEASIAKGDPWFESGPWRVTDNHAGEDDRVVDGAKKPSLQLPECPIGRRLFLVDLLPTQLLQIMQYIFVTLLQHILHKTFPWMKSLLSPYKMFLGDIVDLLLAECWQVNVVFFLHVRCLWLACYFCCVPYYSIATPRG